MATGVLCCIGDDNVAGSPYTLDPFPVQLIALWAGSGYAADNCGGFAVQGVRETSAGCLARWQDGQTLGYSHVLLSTGMPDILSGATAASVWQNLLTMGLDALARIRRYRLRGFFIATVPPMGGAAGFTPAQQTELDALNGLIRASVQPGGLLYDGQARTKLADLNQVLRSPDSPALLHPDYEDTRQGVNGINFNTAGHTAVAAYLDSIFARI